MFPRWSTLLIKSPSDQRSQWKSSTVCTLAISLIRATIIADICLTSMGLTNTDSQQALRRAEMTRSILAKAVAHRFSKSSQEIADELASTYAMSSSERRTNENRIRAMRAANKEFCSYFWRALPVNRTKKNIANFLTTVEQQCREAQQHSSDEFVWLMVVTSELAGEIDYSSNARQLAGPAQRTFRL